MTYLILSIFFSTAIVVIFKLVDRYKADTFNVIVINYIVASSLGFLINHTAFNADTFFKSGWIVFAAIIGALFIVMFLLVAKSVQKAGLGTTTISGRMAVVIPILFSLWFYKEQVSIYKIIGISLAVPAVILTVFRKERDSSKKGQILLPVLLFAGSGLVDSLIKYTQGKYLNSEILPLFSAILFTVALFIGFFIMMFRPFRIKEIFKPSIIIFGVLLGVSNLGSIFCFVNALGSGVFDSSVVFGINHISIISLSVLTGLVFFNEKPALINWFGIVLALITITILTIS